MLRFTFFLTFAFAFTMTAQSEEPLTLTKAKLGSTRNVHLFGSTLLCGQPSIKDFKLAKERGTQVVLTLRGPNETDINEKGIVEGLGMDFHRVAFRSTDTLTDEVFQQTRKILRDAKKNDAPVMLHCGSANRVGAIWIAYRVLDEGVGLAEAEKEALEIGLKNEANQKKTLDYIKRMQK